ncbi:MAG: ABC transporter permease, partial [Hyphomicrobiales bacterium]|nr:ABC transporter permease [Hyphomicrobiales bacterium]
MTALLARRAAGLALALLAASLAIFLALDVLPGNAAQTLLGASATPDAVAALAHKLGLDRPAGARYLAWIAGMARGDFGTSWAYGAPVAPMIGDALKVTLPLAALATAIAAFAAPAIGLFAATRPGGARDAATMALAQAGLALPGFWIAILLILAFAVGLHWAPAGGFPGWSAGAGPALRALALPAIALALPQTAALARVARAAIAAEAGLDYVRTARAKGLTQAQALRRHALRNALSATLSVAGLQFAGLVAGSVVIENVFGLPGLGKLLLQAIENRDTPVLRDGTLLAVALAGAVNLAVDAALAAVDPRRRA